MPNLDHLSYSSISHYLLCPKSWQFHYLDKIVVPVAPALVFGSAFHAAVEGYVSNGYGVEPVTEKPVDIESYWRNAWAKQLGRDQVVDWGATTPEVMADDGARILKVAKIRTFLDELRGAMGPEPIIEKRVELQVPGVPIPIIGYIDVITADGVPGDIKTSSRAWNQARAEGETQSLFYLAALNQAGIEVPSNLFRHYVFTKNSRPTAQTFEHRHNAGEVFWLFEMIQQVWRAIEAEAFPANSTGWKCSPKWCGYWSLCRGRYV